MSYVRPDMRRWFRWLTQRSGDFFDQPPLTNAAARVMSFNQLLADAGFDSETNGRHCREEFGADSLIPPKKRRSADVLATTALRKKMLRRLSVPRVAAARAAYRQCWKARAQALLRGLVHNLDRLIARGCPG